MPHPWEVLPASRVRADCSPPPPPSRAEVNRPKWPAASPLRLRGPQAPSRPRRRHGGVGRMAVSGLNLRRRADPAEALGEGVSTISRAMAGGAWFHRGRVHRGVATPAPRPSSGRRESEGLGVPVIAAAGVDPRSRIRGHASQHWRGRPGVELRILAVNGLVNRRERGAQPALRTDHDSAWPSDSGAQPARARPRSPATTWRIIGILHPWRLE